MSMPSLLKKPEPGAENGGKGEMGRGKEERGRGKILDVGLVACLAAKE